MKTKYPRRPNPTKYKRAWTYLNCNDCGGVMVTRKGLHTGTLELVGELEGEGNLIKFYSHHERSTPCRLTLKMPSPKEGSLGTG